MQIAYGPAAHRGVTKLLAVGDADFAETATDRAVRRGGWIAAAVIAGGVATGSRTARNMGIGAIAALLLVRAAARRAAVEVTAPAPAPAAYY